MQTFPSIIALSCFKSIVEHGPGGQSEHRSARRRRGENATVAPIIGFAHRGAPPIPSAANTLPAFERALQLGARGLETDIGLTADGVPVLVHSGISLRRGLHTGNLTRDRVPAAIPSLRELYARCGKDFELSIDMAQPSSVDAVMRVAEDFGAVDHLWLTYWRLPALITWRQRWPQVHLVYPSMPIRFHAATELVDRLARAGVDVLNVHHRFCRERLIAYAHLRRVRLFAWGIRSRRPLQRVVQLGVDGVYCDNVETMVHILRQHGRP
jgi:glycerophosphoryl diester phosphodiesterase